MNNTKTCVDTDFCCCTKWQLHNTTLRVLLVGGTIMVDNHSSSSHMQSQRGTHVLRNLFRTNSDSTVSSSDDDVDTDGRRDDDDDIGSCGAATLVDNDHNDNDNDSYPPKDFYHKMNTAVERDNAVKPKSTTTIVCTIQHVQLEVCTVGGSIEHRLWPAAEFLVDYLLQQQYNDHQIFQVSRNICSNTKRSSIHSTLCYNVQDIVQRLVSPSSTQTKRAAEPILVEHVPVEDTKEIKVIELGAGVGYTSLELAYHVRQQQKALSTRNHTQFLLTDLVSAIPTLQRNVQRNFGTIPTTTTTTTDCDNVAWSRTDEEGGGPIQVQQLEWGNRDDIQDAISWYNRCTKSSSTPTKTPLLILGSDCVYWESLYHKLETTIATLLQHATPNSICLLANVRRWKRDTSFFQNVFGQHTATSSGQLHCICIHEQVTRSSEYNCNDDDDGGGSSSHPRTDTAFTSEQHVEATSCHEQQQQPQRQVMRIYAIQWISK
jgi:Lysine methyltransferase